MWERFLSSYVSIIELSQRDRIECGVFVWHATDPGSIPSMPFGTPSTSGVISEHRTRSDPWAMPGVTPNQKHFFPAEIDLILAVIAFPHK